MKPVLPREFCAALGLDPSKTMSIKIEVDNPCSVVTAEVKMYVSPEHVAALRKFVLCETGGTVAAPADGGGADA